MMNDDNENQNWWKKKYIYKNVYINIYKKIYKNVYIHIYIYIYIYICYIWILYLNGTLKNTASLHLNQYLL